jgi:hypothetical protein
VLATNIVVVTPLSREAVAVTSIVPSEFVGGNECPSGSGRNSVLVLVVLETRSTTSTIRTAGMAVINCWRLHRITLTKRPSVIVQFVEHGDDVFWPARGYVTTPRRSSEAGMGRT